MKKIINTCAAGVVLAAALQAQVASASSVFITEWMYSGNGGEFVELTNMGSTSVDFSGWSYDDESRTPGTFDLSGLGIVAAGESVIFTEDDVAQFRSDWGLDASVKVVGGVSNNIGRDDEINIYGAFNGTAFPLVDSLLYGDEEYVPGSIRTKDSSGNPGSFAVLGANDALQWELSYVGDEFGSWMSAQGDIGNPGMYSAVPLPGAVWMFGAALAGLVGFRRRKA